MLYIENERTEQSHRTKDRQTEVYVTGYGLYHNDEKDAKKKVS